MYTNNLDLVINSKLVGKSLNSATAPSNDDAIAREVRQLEYDLAEERVRPYVVDMSKALPDIVPLVSINGSCVCSRGNISAICGEAKSKKTFLASALVASAMAIPSARIDNFKSVANNPSINVLWVDTEQGEQHVRRVIQRITAMTGAALGGAVAEPRLTTLALRELSPHERKAMMYDAMRLGVYDLIVIDGIADLQRNTNDLEESDALVAELMALSTLSNTHILCVLHTNPGSDKARGHLGSSLQRKAESVIFVHRAGDCSIVEPQFCRNEPFERFAFTVSEEGIPRLCDMPAASENRNEVIAIVEDIYGGTIERSTLINRLMEMFNCAKAAAHMRVKRLIDRGLLRADGDRVVSTSYTSVGGSRSLTPLTHSHGHSGVTGVSSVNDVNGVNDVNDVNDVNNIDSAVHAAPTPVNGVNSVKGVNGVRELSPAMQRAIDIFTASGIEVEVESIGPAQPHDDMDFPF